MTGRHDDSGDDLDADLRSMFRKMASDTDEEPDAGSFSSLMAAASSRVPAAVPSTWERAREWFLSLARQPAFAAVAMLVVVATVGGVLIAKGGKVAEQTAAPMQNQGAPSVTATVEDGDRVFAETPREPAAPSVAVATAPDESERQAADQSDKAEAKVSAAARAPREPSQEDRGNTDRFRSKPTAKKTVAQDVFDDVTRQSGPQPVTPPAAAPTDKSPAPPPPPPPPSPTTAVTSTGAGGGRTVATKADLDDSKVAKDSDRRADAEGSSAPATPSRSANERALRAALTRGDCAAVRSYATRMKQSELSRYQQIVGEPAIKRCLAS